MNKQQAVLENIVQVHFVLFFKRDQHFVENYLYFLVHVLIIYIEIKMLKNPVCIHKVFEFLEFSFFS